MNEIVHIKSISSTSVLVGAGMAATVVAAAWPAQGPAVLEANQNIPTFSFFNASLESQDNFPGNNFAEKIAAVYETLLEGQEPLGKDIEEAWDKSVGELYES